MTYFSKTPRGQRVESAAARPGAGRITVIAVVTALITIAVVAAFFPSRPQLARATRGFSSGIVFGQAFLYVALVVAVFASIVIAAYVLAARRRRVTIVLTYVEQALRLQLPLASFLETAAAAERGRIGQRLAGVAHLLSLGTPLAAALASELRELPLRAAEAIRAGEANGTLAETMSRVVRDRRRDPPDDPERELDGTWPLAYLAISILPAIVVMALVSLYVMPKLQEIFRDFGITPPASWRTMAALSSFGGNWVGLGALLAAALITIGLLIARSISTVFPRVHVRLFRPSRSAYDRLAWRVPFVGDAIRDRDDADVCATIADALRARRPFDAAVREAAGQRHLSIETRERLDRWHGRLRAGEPINAAARSAGLPALVVGLLTESPEAADAFAFLARHYRARAVGRSRWVAAAVMPAVTLAFGAFVAWFACQIYLPLWALFSGHVYEVRL